MTRRHIPIGSDLELGEFIDEEAGGGGGGSQTLAQVLAEGADANGVQITNLGGFTLDGFNDVDFSGANALNAGTWNGGLDSTEDIKANGRNIEQVANITFDGTSGDLNLDSGGIVGAFNVEIDGALNHDGTTVGFYGTTPITKPTVVLTTPSVQDVIDALVALGLIAQSD